MEHYTEILTNLYVGDRFSSYNSFFEKKDNSLVLINVTYNIEFNKKLKKTIKIRLKINDNASYLSNEILYNNIDDLVDSIDVYINNNYTVLVHCEYGAQRSCSLIAGYLMKYKQVMYKEAINYIKKKRLKAFNIVVNFQSCLIKYEKYLLKNGILINNNIKMENYTEILSNFFIGNCFALKERKINIENRKNNLTIITFDNIDVSLDSLIIKSKIAINNDLDINKLLKSFDNLITIIYCMIKNNNCCFIYYDHYFDYCYTLSVLYLIKYHNFNIKDAKNLIDKNNISNSNILENVINKFEKYLLD